MDTHAGSNPQQQPPDLVERYLRAVARHLPREQRADIVKELAENLRSGFEDREAELGRPLTTAEQEELLKAQGHPLVVAGRYRADQRSVAFGRTLIGPALFPLYVKVLKLNLGITAAVVVVAAIVFAGGQSIVPTASAFFFHLMLQFGIVTLIFSLVETSLARFPHRWNAIGNYQAPVVQDAEAATLLASLTRSFTRRDLPRVPRSESIAQLVIGGIMFFWWLAVPRYLPLIFRPAEPFLRMGPGWQALYLPLLLLGAAVLVQPLVNLFRPDWALFRAAARAVTTATFLLILCRSLAAGNWLVLATSNGDLGRHRQIVDLVNRWCGVSLEIAILFAGVVLLIEAWRWVRAFKARAAPAAAV